MVFLRYVRVYARVSSRNPAAVGTRSSLKKRGAISAFLVLVSAVLAATV